MKNFSVLMSVYKKEDPHFLRESLDSVFTQTLLPTEVVLVEDGPLTDELYEVVESFVTSYTNLRVIPLEKNMGLGNALNEGMKKCRFELIARMDTDDICFPQRFEKQISYMDSHPDVDVLGCWTEEFYEDTDGKKVITSHKKFPETVWNNVKYSTKRCPVEHPAVILRKSAVMAVGGYKHCYLFEDYYLWARMFVNGSKFYNLQEPLLYFRMSDDSFKRRGGLKYAINEYHTLKEFKKIGFMSSFEFFYAVATRFPIRILPNAFRKMFYKCFLRK